MLRYFWHDIRQVYRYMHWRKRDKSLTQLSAELLFQYHKLEKGLVMPGEKRLFGTDPAKKVIEILSQWDRRGFSENSPIRLGALETLHAYLNFLVSEQLDPNGQIIPNLREFLQPHTIRTKELSTPRPLKLSISSFGGIDAFSKLVESRRSVRVFKTDKPPVDNIKTAVELALQSPSACNRQPCKIYVVEDDVKKKDILSLQNGNRGFGHKIPTLVVITSDTQVFFDASERNEPYVDGGLFAMTFMYALTAQGLASCCLNWCVSPSIDHQLRKMIPLPETEYVIMLMAVGYPENNVMVPRSPRRSVNEVLIEV